VLETSHPPVYYIPQRYQNGAPGFDAPLQLVRVEGRAAYYKVVVGDKQVQAAWFYPDPTPALLLSKTMWLIRI